jgi:tetratricopeptide (TPR) repeat protein
MPRQAEKLRDRRLQRQTVPSSPAARAAIAPFPGAPASRDEHGSLRQSRGRRFWLAAAGAALLALIGVLGLLRWRAATSGAGVSAKTPVDPAEARLRRALEAQPNDATARLEMGKYCEGHARPFEAMWEYAEAQHLKPADAELPGHLASVLQTGQSVDLAAAQLQQGLAARPADLELRRGLAELYLSTAEPEHARSVMEDRREAVWQDLDAVVMLGRARQACGDTAGAVNAFKRSLALQPRQDQAWYRLGRLYLSLGRGEEAQDGFFHAIAADTSQPDYSLYAGMSYLQKPGPGGLDRAIRFFKQALAVRPNLSQAYYQYGIALEREGKRKDAVSEYEQAVLTDLNEAAPNLALGQSLMAAGNRYDGHRYLGRYYDLADRPAQAASEFHTMQALAPESVQPALLEGQIYIRTQQSSRAAAVTEAALRRHPDDIQLLERLAVLKINRGDRPYARRLLHHWLDLKPKASRPCWLLGRCDFGDLKYAEGIAWLEKAIQRQPREPDYYGFLGGGLLRVGTTESRRRAVDVLAQAVALAPENAEYRDLYGQALTQLGRYEEALQQYLKALNSDPFRISCYTPVSQLAWRLHRPGPGTFFPVVIRSVQDRLNQENLLWPHVWEQPHDAVGRLKLARFLCRTADLTKARHQLEQALEQRPDWPEARQLLATVRRAQDAL